MTTFRGMPYVPGRVRGTLRPVDEAYGGSDIVMLAEQDIGRLRELPAGFLVVDGAPLSHDMIHLMGAGVPTVIVDARQAARLVLGNQVELDGTSGEIASPPAGAAVPPTASRASPGDGVATADGTPVRLLASVRSPDAARRARLGGAAAIGLVRSEFLLPEDGRKPDAAFYRATLGDLCAAAAPLAVTIRLLDIAGDKLPPWLPPGRDLGGLFGLQGVRLFSEEPVKGVVLAQLEAIDSLQPQFPLRLLIPYLVRHEELRHWVGELRRRLQKPLPIGAMVETPAAALDLGNWFDSAEFVAIGCNDLMQCFFAADRDRAELRGYLDPYAPPLYRLLKQVADAAAAHLERVQLCGVLAQLPGVLPILLGLGFRAFSVEVALLPHLANRVHEVEIAACTRLAGEVCAARESHEVLELMGLGFGDYRPFVA